MPETKYVLITPAKNEQTMIGRTIQAVVSQTFRPKKWVIVDDGSTDRTRDIIADAAHQHSFILPIYNTANKGANFGSKVAAFKMGYEVLKSESYEFVGNVDADVSFGPDYYEQVIRRLQADASLGIAGGLVYELTGRDWHPQRNSVTSVAGAVQCFRRECYEAIGGYIPITTGGIDAAAEIMARAQGWTVRMFSELPVFHHRRVATGRSTVLSTRFVEGTTNYRLGYHPLFQLGSSMSRCIDRPWLLGSLATLLGYSWAWLRGCRLAMSVETVRYLRAEQMTRMGLCFRGRTREGR